MSNLSLASLLKTRQTFVVVLAFGLFAMAARGMLDPDIWWHLRTGQLIVHNHHLFHADPYSFTRSGQPWVNHEWLFDVLAFALYRVAGAGTLIFAFALITSSTFLLVFSRCPGKPYMAGVVTVLGAIASVSSWGVRPQMISLLLATVFLFLLEHSDQRPGVLWWLVPLTVLWVNLHAGYALGISLIALSLLGSALDSVFQAERSAQSAVHLRRLFVVLVACCSVVLINPYGVQMYVYPFQTLRSPGMQRFIQEWFSPDFHDPKYLPVVLMILGILLGIASSPKRLTARELLLLLPTMASALWSVRHIPVFMVVAAPMLAGFLEGWRGGARVRLFNDANGKSRPSAVLVNALLILGVAGFATARAWWVVQQQPAAEARQFPAAAVSFLVKERPPQPLVNHYNWGGYLVWKLYPDYRVYIDGRADVYGDDFMSQFASAYYITNDWKKPLRQWSIWTVVLPPDSPLVTALRSSPEWKQIYTDAQAAVLRRVPTESNSLKTK
jgi:hypothetical protein